MIGPEVTNRARLPIEPVIRGRSLEEGNLLLAPSNVEGGIGRTERKCESTPVLPPKWGKLDGGAALPLSRTIKRQSHIFLPRQSRMFN